MELGNLFFGNSRGEYSLNDRRREYEEIFDRLLDALEMDYHGEEFENDTFIIFPYYWGDCTCGFEEREAEFFESVPPHADDCFNTKYQRFKQDLARRGIYLYSDEAQRLKEAFAKENGYPHGSKGIANFCDCGRDDLVAMWYAENDHDPTCPVVRPNFVHKPSGLEVRWYKYAMRDAYTNRPVTPEEFAEIIDECIRSVKGGER